MPRPKSLFLTFSQEIKRALSGRLNLYNNEQYQQEAASESPPQENYPHFDSYDSMFQESYEMHEEMLNTDSLEDVFTPEQSNHEDMIIEPIMEEQPDTEDEPMTAIEEIEMAIDEVSATDEDDQDEILPMDDDLEDVVDESMHEDPLDDDLERLMPNPFIHFR